MNITLDDLRVLEPRLVVVDDEQSAGAVPPGQEPVAVSWAVTARATPPHLPHLRGGEVLLISQRVRAAIEPEMPALLREARARGVSAVVLEAPVTTYPHSIEIPVLAWLGAMTEETEAGINRVLTEARGDLYRVGSELERRMADLAVNGGGLAALVQIASETSGLPIVVCDRRGRRLAASREEILASHEPRGDDPSAILQRTLPLAGTLRLGPLAPAERVMARFLADRIATAAGAALQRDESARPRGSQRVEAMESLLRESDGRGSDQRAAALALGLDPDATFLVAISRGAREADLARSLAPLGEVFAAGANHERGTAVVAVASGTGRESILHRVEEVKRRWSTERGEDLGTLALSAPAPGVAGLPAAAREAAFVANLQAQETFPRPAASFDSVADLGAWRLLFQVRHAPALRQFHRDVLGELAQHDPRGTLRATLRAFLESGGSHVDTAARLGIHRNTLTYRLRRIGELVGQDVFAPASWLTLHLALYAEELCEAASDAEP
jgi:purine catabolism regulator